TSSHCRLQQSRAFNHSSNNPTTIGAFIESFGPHQYEELKDRLSNWRRARLLESIHQAIARGRRRSSSARMSSRVATTLPTLSSSTRRRDPARQESLRPPR